MVDNTEMPAILEPTFQVGRQMVKEQSTDPPVCQPVVRAMGRTKAGRQTGCGHTCAHVCTRIHMYPLEKEPDGDLGEKVAFR